MLSCPTCDYTTKVKCNLDRHIPKCKKGTKKVNLYICYDCQDYYTENKTAFENHQQSTRCKNRLTNRLLFKDQLQQLQDIVDSHDKIITKLMEVIEFPVDEEETKDKIRRDLTRHGVQFDVGETLNGLRYLNRELQNRLRMEKIEPTSLPDLLA
jgi:hypothetical protein